MPTEFRNHFDPSRFAITEPTKISVCSLVGHDWKLADDNTIDYQWTCGCIFIQQLIDIICASDTGLESESQNDDDTGQSTEVDNMIDVVYEDETDDEANF